MSDPAAPPPNPFFSPRNPGSSASAGAGTSENWGPLPRARNDRKPNRDLIPSAAHARNRNTAPRATARPEPSLHLSQPQNTPLKNRGVRQFPAIWTAGVFDNLPAAIRISRGPSKPSSGMPTLGSQQRKRRRASETPSTHCLRSLADCSIHNEKAHMQSARSEPQRPAL